MVVKDHELRAGQAAFAQLEHELAPTRVACRLCKTLPTWPDFGQGRSGLDRRLPLLQRAVVRFPDGAATGNCDSLIEEMPAAVMRRNRPAPPRREQDGKRAGPGKRDVPGGKASTCGVACEYQR